MAAAEAASLTLRSRRELFCLVGLNVLNSIDDVAANLEKCRSYSLPTPPLKRAGADAPAAGDIDLIEVFGIHCGVPRVRVNDCGEGRCTGREKIYVAVGRKSGRKSVKAGTTTGR